MLKDGTTVEVEPVFARLRRQLDDYTPEKAAEICGIHPDNIRTLARKVATRKTKIFIGWNSGKYYHGDLMERAMALLLGAHRQLGQEGHRHALVGRRRAGRPGLHARQGRARPGGRAALHRRR